MGSQTGGREGWLIKASVQGGPAVRTWCALEQPGREAGLDPVPQPCGLGQASPLA